MVTELDIENRRCYVAETDVNYYTDSLVKVDLRVLTEDERTASPQCQTVIGDVLVRSIVGKFKKIRFQSHENVGYGDIDLPEEQMHTRSVVFLFPPETAVGTALEAMAAPGRAVALQRLVRLLRSVAPVYLMAQTQDLGVHASVRDPHFNMPACYLYDQYPGGSGLSEAFALRYEWIVNAAVERVTECMCDGGCPSCVGPPDIHDGWDGNPKEAVMLLLSAWTHG